MEWTDEVIGKLRILWSEGHSTAEIGRRLNISKNAVVGKAHRLTLPPRPSPIKRNDGTGQAAPRPAPPRRAFGPTLPPLAASTAPPVPSLRAIMPSPKQTLRATPCCWPIGEPGKPDFHFCNSGSVPGKPYCDDHAAIAYVRVRDRREDAA
jgi:GcrA cell cycle regulator